MNNEIAMVGTKSAIVGVGGSVIAATLDRAFIVGLVIGSRGSQLIVVI